MNLFDRIAIVLFFMALTDTPAAKGMWLGEVFGGAACLVLGQLWSMVHHHCNDTSDLRGK